jgi:hypothetical protein
VRATNQRRQNKNATRSYYGFSTTQVRPPFAFELLDAPLKSIIAALGDGRTPLKMFH